MTTKTLDALDALRGVLDAFAQVRDDEDYVVRAASRLDDVGTTPSLTWGDLRSVERQVREQVARDIETLSARPKILAAGAAFAGGLTRAARVARGERP